MVFRPVDPGIVAQLRGANGSASRHLIAAEPASGNLVCAAARFDRVILVGAIPGRAIGRVAPLVPRPARPAIEVAQLCFDSDDAPFGSLDTPPRRPDRRVVEGGKPRHALVQTRLDRDRVEKIPVAGQSLGKPPVKPRPIAG